MIAVGSLYERMVTIRLLEDRLQKLCDQGLAGDLHFNKGQEAIAVGVCAALEDRDQMVTHHRTIAHQVARGADVRGLVAELLGRRTGINGGRAGEMHISDRSIGHAFSFQLVATCIPVAAGLAWGLKKHHGSGAAVACFFGDAASSNGQFHEGMNLAAIHRLPILFVCENNKRAGNITPEHYAPSTWVGERVGHYGIPWDRTDGNSVESVYGAASEALRHVRGRDGGPFFLELMTERLCWHKQGQRDVRTADELARAAAGDPLKKILAGEVDEVGIGRRLDEIIASVMEDPPPDY